LLLAKRVCTTTLFMPSTNSADSSFMHVTGGAATGTSTSDDTTPINKTMGSNGFHRRSRVTCFDVVHCQRDRGGPERLSQELDLALTAPKCFMNQTAIEMFSTVGVAVIRGGLVSPEGETSLPVTSVTGSAVSCMKALRAWHVD